MLEFLDRQMAEFIKQPKGGEGEGECGIAFNRMTQAKDRTGATAARAAG